MLILINFFIRSKKNEDIQFTYQLFPMTFLYIVKLAMNT